MFKLYNDTNALEIDTEITHLCFYVEVLVFDDEENRCIARIQLKDGYVLSVAMGFGSYSSNRHIRDWNDEGNICEASTVEIAIIDINGSRRYIDKINGTVKADVNPLQFLEIITILSTKGVECGIDDLLDI